MKKTNFSNCTLRETDFTEADLTGAVFDRCDLAGSVFDHTLLEKADLRTAINFTIDPDRNRIAKARFSLEGLPGLLNRFDIIIE